MTSDRWHKDYDRVENLGDIIDARRDRDAPWSDDVDGMADADVSDVDIDVSHELGYPHHHGKTQAQQEGLNTELMDTPKERDVQFDWQDSAEEMNPTDPDPSEGMGMDPVIESLSEVDVEDLVGPVPSTEISPETGTAATEDEKEQYGLDGGENEVPCPQAPVQLDTAMDSESDEDDFRIEDKFDGEIDHMAAEYEFEMMRRATEEAEQK